MKWNESLLNEIPGIFHNGSDYDYLIIKKLANEFEGQFECLGENTGKYKTFSALMEKEVTKIDKDDHEHVVTISYEKNIYWNCKIYGKFIIKSCW